MSRIEYNEDGDWLQWGRWSAAAKKAIGGKRGQALLRELEAALLALPNKRLIAGDFTENGEVCALGALAVKRKTDSGTDRLRACHEVGEEFANIYDDSQAVAEHLSMTHTLAWEVMEKNDNNRFYSSTPGQRYEGVLAWVREQIKKEDSPK